MRPFVNGNDNEPNLEPSLFTNISFVKCFNPPARAPPPCDPLLAPLLPAPSVRHAHHGTSCPRQPAAVPPCMRVHAHHANWRVAHALLQLPWPTERLRPLVIVVHQPLRMCLNTVCGRKTVSDADIRDEMGAGAPNGSASERQDRLGKGMARTGAFHPRPRQYQAAFFAARYLIKRRLLKLAVPLCERYCKHFGIMTAACVRVNSCCHAC